MPVPCSRVCTVFHIVFTASEGFKTDRLCRLPSSHRGTLIKQALLALHQVRSSALTASQPATPVLLQPLCTDGHGCSTCILCSAQTVLVPLQPVHPVGQAGA